MNHYIEFFNNLNIHSGNIQHYSNTIKECKKSIKLAEIRCKPTKKKQRLAQWQKELRALILQLEYSLPDEELIANMDLSPDNTGNPYFVQLPNVDLVKESFDQNYNYLIANNFPVVFDRNIDLAHARFLMPYTMKNRCKVSAFEKELKVYVSLQKGFQSLQ